MSPNPVNTIRTFLRKPLSWILVLLVFLMGWIGWKSGAPPDFRQSFQKALLEKEIQLGKYLAIMDREMDQSGTEAWIMGRAGYWEGVLEKNGFVAVLIRHDSLVYWSDHAFTPPADTNFYLKPNRVDFIDNSFLVRQVFPRKAGLLAGFIRIKTRFPIQNGFLENSFAPGFDLPSETLVSLETPRTLHWTISLGDGKAHFYLIPPPSLPATHPLVGLIPDILLLLLILGSIRWISLGLAPRHPAWAWLSALALVVLGKGLLLVADYRGYLHSSSLGNPAIFSQSLLFNSLADAIFNGVFVLLFALSFHRNFPARFTKGVTPAAYPLALLPVFGAFTWWIHVHLSGFILNSTIGFDILRVYDIDQYTMLALALMIGLMTAWVLIARGLIVGLIRLMDPTSLVRGGMVILAGFLVLALFQTDSAGLALVFYPALFLSILILEKRGQTLSYSGIAILVLLVSALFAHTITRSFSQRNHDKYLTYLQNVSSPRNAITEFQLTDFFKKIRFDSRINDYLREATGNLKDYIISTYFQDQLAVFDVRIFLCSPQDSLFIEQDNRLRSCNEFFSGLTRTGEQIPGTTFFYLDDISGFPGYIGSVDLFDEQSQRLFTLFFDLRSKLKPDALGYPELLADENTNSWRKEKNFSLARFRNGTLISQTGKYPYPLRLEELQGPAGLGTPNGTSPFEHLILKSDPRNTVVLSYPAMNLGDHLVAFLYVYVFLNVIFSIGMLVVLSTRRQKAFLPGLRSKIMASMIIILSISLVVVGTGSTLYIIRQNEKKNSEILTEKAQSVLVELENKLFNEPSLGYSRQSELTTLLIKLSNVFFADINLFLPDGNLLASSRPEIFSNHLTGTLMDMEAYRNLRLGHSGRYMHQEQIGNLEFLSAYQPFRNRDNQVLAYLNLPYFTRQSALKEELVSSVMAIVNIYIFLIMLSIVVAILITSRLTHPLSLIKEKISEIRLGRPVELIEYRSRDEIGDLVKEYNRMVSELADSAEKLAQSERESAWREMARQVAHEIKNPLTPMKLMAQHLQRAWKDNPADLGEKITRTTNLLIEQIDALSNIATEFSNFAKIPRTVNQAFDLIPVLERTVQLFRTGEVPIVSRHEDREAWVFADPDQIQRVFINLLKNSLQALEGQKEGRILIQVETLASQVVLVFSDNGPGISTEAREKLFQPNFTTKSGGTGLGLAISRSIIESAGGSIRLVPSDGPGTRFEIHLPRKS